MVSKGEGGEGGKEQRHKERIAVATYNIQDGRNGGFLSVTWALDHANVDIAVVQVCSADGIRTRDSYDGGGVRKLQKSVIVGEGERGFQHRGGEGVGGECAFV